MLYTRRRIIVSKQEATPGVVESLTSTDGAGFYFNPVLTLPNQKTQRPQQASNNFLPSIMGPQQASLVFEAEIAGKGAGGIPTWASTFLPCCGFLASSQTYTRSFDSSNQKTCTIGFYQDGWLHTLGGCGGDVDFEITNGSKGVARFTMLGKYMGRTTSALPSPPSVTAATAPRGMASLTFGSDTPVTEKLTLRAGNKSLLIPTLINDSASSGFSYTLIPDAEATAEVEAMSLTSRNYWSLMSASTEEAMSAVVGTVTNNVVTFAAAAAEVVEHSPGDKGGLVTDVVKFMLNQGFTIAFS